MTNTNQSSDTSNIFKKISGKLGRDPVLPVWSNHSASSINEYTTPYYSAERTNVLFLSKRGISRSPLAREVTRHLLHFSNQFGSIRPSARGISDAYDNCPFDKRMIHAAKKYGYQISGHSRRVNLAELSSANLIIALDEESFEYTRSRMFYIRGEVRPVITYLPEQPKSFILDPFERDDCSDPWSRYDAIIRSTEFGCANMLKDLPSILFNSAVR